MAPQHTDCRSCSRDCPSIARPQGNVMSSKQCNSVCFLACAADISLKHLCLSSSLQAAETESPRLCGSWRFSHLQMGSNIAVRHLQYAGGGRDGDGVKHASPSGVAWRGLQIRANFHGASGGGFPYATREKAMYNSVGRCHSNLTLRHAISGNSCDGLDALAKMGSNYSLTSCGNSCQVFMLRSQDALSRYLGCTKKGLQKSHPAG